MMIKLKYINITMYILQGYFLGRKGYFLGRKGYFLGRKGYFLGRKSIRDFYIHFIFL